MRVLKTLLAFALVATCTQAALAQWPDTTAPGNSRFWMEANGKVLDRPGSQLGVPLITNDITKDVVLTTDQITDLGSTAGAEVRFGSHSKLMGIDWEFGTQFGGWETDFSANGPDLASPFFAGLDPDIVGVNYKSDFVSLELNMRKALFPGLTFLTGPRYFRLTEDMNLTSSTTIDTLSGPFTVNTQDMTNIVNSAIGWQIGMEYNQPVTRDIYLQGFIRTAGLLNGTRLDRSSQTTLVDQTTTSVSKDTGMFIGTTGGRVYFTIIPNSLRSYAGYEAQWIDGVAIGPAQFLGNGTESIDTTNTIFWHAITFGLRFTY